MKKLTELSPNTIKSYKRDLYRYRKMLADGDPRVAWLKNAIAKLERQFAEETCSVMIPGPEQSAGSEQSTTTQPTAA